MNYNNRMSTKGRSEQADGHSDSFRVFVMDAQSHLVYCASSSREEAFVAFSGRHNEPNSFTGLKETHISEKRL